MMQNNSSFLPRRPVGRVAIAKFLGGNEYETKIFYS